MRAARSIRRRPSALRLGAIAAAILAIAPGAAPAAAPGNSAGRAEAALQGVWIPQSAPERLLTVDGKEPPLTPAAKTLYDQRRAMRRAGDLSFDRTSWCASPGMPRIMQMPYPFEIKGSNGLLAFIYGWYRWHRVVDMSGQPADAILPLTMGYPVGRREGNVLVIRTVGLTDETILDASGLPHSDEMVLTERLRILPDGRLEDRLTVEDPANYTRPWDAVLTFVRKPGMVVGDDVCPDRIRRGLPAVVEGRK